MSFFEFLLGPIYNQYSEGRTPEERRDGKCTILNI